MKVLTRALAAVAIAGSCAVGAAGVAAAAPASHGARASIPITCANGVNGTAVLQRSTSHKMRWFVLHVTGGTKKQKVLVPTAIDVTFTFTSSSGQVTTNTENISKKSHAKNQTSCTINGPAPVDGGTLAADGNITGAFH